MHPIQNKILALLRDQGSIPLKYREIGRRIGEKYPQTVKHHIEALLENDLIVNVNASLKLNSTDISGSDFLNLPFYGLANCGPALNFAEDQADGFIKISRKILPKPAESLFIIRASGNSMNQSKIGSLQQNIEDGDFVIVDSQKKDPKDGDYIVSVIDNCANIKKFRYDPVSHQVHLLSESSDEYFPIILHESDNFHIIGQVIEVLKTI